MINLYFLPSVEKLRSRLTDGLQEEMAAKGLASIRYSKTTLEVVRCVNMF